jgi:RES domain-containing protein
MERAAAAIGSCERTTWSGHVWRFHGQKYDGDSADGSLKVSGRFNRGVDKFSEEDTWPALYTCLAPHVAIGERVRHTTPQDLSKLATQSLSRLWVKLQHVIVLCSSGGCDQLAFSEYDLDGEFCHPVDYGATQELAEVAYRTARAEAMMVPSCTGFRDGNLIIFPDRLMRGSHVVVKESVHPNLYIDW